MSINPQLEPAVYPTFIRDEYLDRPPLRQVAPHYVVDAIDTLSPKVHLIKSSLEPTPFISVMGAGAKPNPTIRIGRMDRAYNCPLCTYMIRKRLRKLGVPPKFPVIYSEELPHSHAIVETEGEQNKKSVTGTIAYNPAVAGCYAAYAAINHLLELSNNE